MFTKGVLVFRSMALATILATLGWLMLILCWMAFAWSQHSVFQNLASMGIATLAFAAIVGALWAMDLGIRPAATILTTLGWLSFVLYWIGFAWSRHGLLLNSAILLASLLACGGVVAGLWLSPGSDECC